MKLNRVAKSMSIVLRLALLLAVSAFASNKGSVELREAVEVNGQTLAPGEYQLRWEGTGSNVAVSFMQGKKEIAKTSAKVIELSNSSAGDSTVIDHSNGKAAISEVRFGGKKYALAIGATERTEMAGGASSSK